MFLSTRKSRDLARLVIPHSLYSPDLVASHNQLLPKLKENLIGLCFRNDDVVEEGVTRFHSELAAEFYDILQKSVKRLLKNRLML